MKACFIVGAVLLILGGCSLTNSVVVQQRLERVPRMTCGELARQGAPADGQVLLTDVMPCSQTVAARLDGDLYLYVPAYSAGLANEPASADLGFLMQIWGDDERRRLLGQAGPVEATCWVTKGPRVVALGRGPGDIETWARDGLDRKYPGIRLGEMWVLTYGHGLTPTAERARSAWRYGIIELVLGVAALGCGVFLGRHTSPRAAARG